MRTKQSGFTLIELMVVVAILAILAVIAYPAYQEQVRKGRRAEVQALMQDIALTQERWRTNDTDYATLAELGGSPGTDFYNITIPTANATQYIIQATATGDQVNDAGCTTLCIDQDNTRGVVSGGACVANDTCW